MILCESAGRLPESYQLTTENAEKIQESEGQGNRFLPAHGLLRVCTPPRAAVRSDEALHQVLRDAISLPRGAIYPTLCLTECDDFSILNPPATRHISVAYGGVPERLKGAVLKTVDPHGSVGSNPTPTAIRGRNCSGSAAKRLLQRTPDLIPGPFFFRFLDLSHSAVWSGEVLEWLNRAAC
jgi:hypothetical protein